MRRTLLGKSQRIPRRLGSLFSGHSSHRGMFRRSASFTHGFLRMSVGRGGGVHASVKNFGLRTAFNRFAAAGRIDHNARRASGMRMRGGAKPKAQSRFYQTWNGYVIDRQSMGRSPLRTGTISMDNGVIFGGSGNRVNYRNGIGLSGPGATRSVGSIQQEFAGYRAKASATRAAKRKAKLVRMTSRKAKQAKMTSRHNRVSRAKQKVKSNGQVKSYTKHMKSGKTVKVRAYKRNPRARR